MRIISANEHTVSLKSRKKNAGISFNEMTASAVVVEIETARGHFKGLGFSSYGRYSHGGLLRERFFPRLRNISDTIPEGTSVQIVSDIWNKLMADEKEGGHGERSAAVGVVETALWDALAKSEEMPLWALLERDVGHADTAEFVPGKTAIYASGGHYLPNRSGVQELATEVKKNMEFGYGWSKIKIGGVDPTTDMKRIEAAINAAGDPKLIAVDANCAYDANSKEPFLHEIDRLGLRWVEEPVNPLNYRGLGECAVAINTPIATGENIFSRIDAWNLLEYGGLRSNQDYLQMDIVLSYGLSEYIRIIKDVEAHGWSRKSLVPHAGHQLALHAAAGLGLGGHEVASSENGPFSGVSKDTEVRNGLAILGTSPGIGIENKPELFKYFDGLI